MGMDLNIYTKGLTTDLLPKLKKRFADYAMDIEFHPDFKLNEQTDTGFCPIKLKMQLGFSTHYDNFGDEVLTGFELYFDDYVHQEEFKKNKSETSKKPVSSFFSKLFGSNKNTVTEEIDVTHQYIEDQLRQCCKTLTLNWQSENKSELRIGLFFGAILAEQTKGVIYDPQNGRYLTGEQALASFPGEIKEYEDSYSTEEFTLHKFEEWR